MNRKFVRLSLGGVRDEAEIRGHRRTYIGAFPGQIIQMMKKAGTMNPVFLLDEVDKMSMDFRGDPSAALLEVLDPEQNNTFLDHYLDVEYDLSNVMFICTANVLHTIPQALRDRMEVLQLAGYTELEKVEIAKKFLAPKAVEGAGLTKDNITFTDEALQTVIQRYTREAGVRNLEREISSICRKVARKVVVEGTELQRGDHRRQGHRVPRRAALPHRRWPRRQNEIGIATGLAWTEVGGEILVTEATLMPGKGKLTLTGKLGDVMQESAQAAMSYVRSKAEEFGIPKDFNRKTDVHIHVPEGAIPKDGPSAGITLATALVSALTRVPVRKDVAMTGEITLRGKVLPIGGVKEKVLAAHRAGIKNIILPKDNEKDLADIPKNVLDTLNVYMVADDGRGAEDRAGRAAGRPAAGRRAGRAGRRRSSTTPSLTDAAGFEMQDWRIRPSTASSRIPTIPAPNPSPVKIDASFVTSAASASDLPRDGLAGDRAGRALECRQVEPDQRAACGSALARTSAAPGKTRLANCLSGCSAAAGARRSIWSICRATATRAAARRGARVRRADARRTSAGARRQRGDVARRGRRGAAAARRRAASGPRRATSTAWRVAAAPTVERRASSRPRSTSSRAANGSARLRELESVFETSVLPVSADTGEGLDELWKLIDTTERTAARGNRAAATAARRQRRRAPKRSEKIELVDAQGHERRRAHQDRQAARRAGRHRHAQAGADLRDPEGARREERPDLLRRRARNAARRLRLPARARLQLPARARRHLRLAVADPQVRPAHRRHRVAARSGRRRTASATSR